MSGNYRRRHNRVMKSGASLCMAVALALTGYAVQAEETPQGISATAVTITATAAGTDTMNQRAVTTTDVRDKTTTSEAANAAAEDRPASIDKERISVPEQTLVTADGKVLNLPSGVTATLLQTTSLPEKDEQLLHMEKVLRSTKGSKMLQTLAQVSSIPVTAHVYQLRGEDEQGVHIAFLTDQHVGAAILPATESLETAVHDDLAAADESLKQWQTQLESSTDDADAQRRATRVKGVRQLSQQLQGAIDDVFKENPTYPGYYDPVDYYQLQREYLRFGNPPENAGSRMFSAGRDIIAYLIEWYQEEMKPHWDTQGKAGAAHYRGTETALHIIKSTAVKEDSWARTEPVNSVWGNGILQRKLWAVTVDGFETSWAVMNLQRYDSFGPADSTVIMNDADRDYWEEQLCGVWQIKTPAKK